MIEIKTNVLGSYVARSQATRTESRVGEDEIAGLPWPKALYMEVRACRKRCWGGDGFHLLPAPLPAQFRLSCITGITA